MPNIKSAKKRVKTDAKKREMNRTAISSMRTAIKKAKIAIKNNEGKEEAVNNAIKLIDKNASNGLIHANKAAREKSKLMKINK
jgi:small subunit ribosomal protein S20